MVVLVGELVSKGVRMPVLADDRENLNWRKANRSMNHGACAEVANGVVGGRGIVAIRDSQDREGLVLRYSGSAWRSFLVAAKKGSLDAYVTS
jgi:hypothetical protein